jgi:replicative DNA helicase
MVARSKDSQTHQTPIHDLALPSDIDAEMGVIGSVILAPEVLDDITDVVRHSDFLDERHSKLFRVINEMYQEGKKVDTMLLVSRLKKEKLFEAVGGAAYIAQLARAVPHAANAVYYATIVREHSTKRACIVAAHDTIREATEPSTEAREVVNAAEGRFFELLERNTLRQAETIKEFLHRALDRAEARHIGEMGEDGLSTGLNKLDETLGGLRKSELIVLAARPSMGKSALALNIAEHVSIKEEKPVLFISLEMSADELADRMLTSAARCNAYRVRHGQASDEEMTTLRRTSAKIISAPLYVDDNPKRMVMDIAAAGRRVRRKAGDLALIVIDYLQLIEPDNMKVPRQEQVASITRRLKLLAKEMQCPVLCLAQLNRQAEAGTDHRPKLSHLRESGAIEQDADVVIFVHREEFFSPDNDKVKGQADLIVAKQRSGPIGDVKVAWMKDWTRFENLATDTAKFAPRDSTFDAFNAGAAIPAYESEPGPWDGLN